MLNTKLVLICKCGWSHVNECFSFVYWHHGLCVCVFRVDCSGRKVASLDVDGVVKVWAFNPIMQTKATIMSKSPLLSLEWAAKPDRLVNRSTVHEYTQINRFRWHIHYIACIFKL